MAGSTISAYYAGQVYLGTGAFKKTLTVTATGTIAGGVTDSSTLTGVSITNDGTIFGGTSFDAAIWLQSSGHILNDGFIKGSNAVSSAGTPVTGDAGIVLAVGGTITNAGMVEGGNGAGFSSKTDKGGNGGEGVVLEGACRLRNTGEIVGGLAGTLSGNYATTSGDGILAEHYVQISNYGTIAGGAGSSSFYYFFSAGDAIVMAAGGYLNNDGKITGGVGGSDDAFDGGGSFGGVGIVLSAPVKSSIAV
jgi:hypothetical protein